MSVARNWRSFLVTVDHGAGSARGRRSAAFLLTWVLLGAVGGQAFAGAQGATPTAGDLKQLSIEDLMNLDVTSVAKEPQRLLQAAAAIQVITADDIRRSGASSIPEVLRLADNLEVAQINAHDWVISARGFDANLTNKLLVLVDGRAVYTPLYGGVLWNVQGDFYSGAEDVPATGGAGLSGGNVLGRWTHETPGGASMNLQVYYDHTHLSQPFPASPAAPPFFSGFPAASLQDDLDTYDLDFQYHFSWSARHKVAWGLGYRATRESDEDLSIVRFTPAVLNQSLYSGFAQDETSLARRLYLTVGSKLEHNDYTGFEFEPSARLQWNPQSTHLLWGAISRAVRTPSRYDRDLTVPSGLINAPPPFQFPTTDLRGAPDFISEKLLAYEVGYRAELGPKLSTSVSAFYNRYHGLLSTTA